MNGSCLLEEEGLGLPEAMAGLIAGHLEDSNTRALRRWVKSRPSAVRAALAKQTLWTYGRFETPDGRRCLVAHVAFIQEKLGLPKEQPDLTVASSFDSVADRLGLWAAVALVRDACGAVK
jgi:hypothetical protein